MSKKPVAAKLDPNKMDLNKIRWDILPWDQLEQVAQVFTDGMAKYGHTPWEKLHLVDNAEDRYFAALMRHIIAWRKKEALDPESKRHHLAHAACNVLMLLWMEQNGFFDES